MQPDAQGDRAARYFASLLREIRYPSPRPFYQILYWAGFVCSLLLFLVVATEGGQADSLNGLALMTGILWSAAFCAYAWADLRGLWKHGITKVCAFIINGFALWFAIVLSQELVGRAFGLPPHDFQITVSFFALIYYYVAWIFVLTAVGSMVSLSGLLVIYFQVVSRMLVGLVAPLLHLFTLGLVPAPSVTRSQMPAWGWHVVGILSLAWLVLAGLTELLQQDASAYPFVRRIAHSVDFHPAENYPGIKQGERIRILENGIILFSSLDEEGRVSIECRRVQDNLTFAPCPKGH